MRFAFGSGSCIGRNDRAAYRREAIGAAVMEVLEQRRLLSGQTAWVPIIPPGQDVPSTPVEDS